jgi:hypothetical protein
MKTQKNYLLPSYAKYIGFIIASIAIILAFVSVLSGKIKINELFLASSGLNVFAIYAMLVVAFTAIGFSKLQNEDEYSSQIRFQSFFISIGIHAVFFVIFSFTSITINLITFPAIILMNSILLIYLIVFLLKSRE